MTPMTPRAPASEREARERRAPVQGERGQPDGTIPWATHLAAWAGYGSGYGQSAERIAERGGFGYREVQCAIAGHYGKTRDCRLNHPVPTGWLPR